MKTAIQIKLSSYKYKKDKLKELIVKINKLELEINSVPSTSVINFTKDRNTKESTNTIDKKISNLLDLKEEYKRLMYDVDSECMYVATIIDENIHDPLTNQIFYKYYCCNESFEKIAVDLGYSFPHIRNVFYTELKRLSRKKLKIVQKSTK